MNISPDDIILWQMGFVHLNATILFTWLLMLLLVIGAALITRRLPRYSSSETSPEIVNMSRWQNLLEILVIGLKDQIGAINQRDPAPYLPFIGTLFIFVLSANLLIVLPGYQPPTGSLSTTAALAICVFIAVPFYGVSDEGLSAYLRRYLKPTPLMLPFNLIGEFSRTIALAVRLYGNIMSGTIIVAILLTLMPFFFPIILQLLGLITGTVQAYIFAILATVYTASASTPHIDSSHMSPDSVADTVDRDDMDQSSVTGAIDAATTSNSTLTKPIPIGETEHGKP